MKPMYKLLIILLNHSNIIQLKPFKYKYANVYVCGICGLIDYLCQYKESITGSEYTKLYAYISYRITLTSLIRRGFQAIYVGIFNHELSYNQHFYWRQGWKFPRRLYLIRHIFYCWLWYWISKPFKN